MRRRYMPVDELRVTTHGIRVLEIMRKQGIGIYYDEETCALLTEPNRKISHWVVKSLRAQRFIRPRGNDRALHVLTGRAIELLDTDPRTRQKEHTT